MVVRPEYAHCTSMKPISARMFYCGDDMDCVKQSYNVQGGQKTGHSDRYGGTASADKKFSQIMHHKERDACSEKKALASRDDTKDNCHNQRRTEYSSRGETYQSRNGPPTFDVGALIKDGASVKEISQAVRGHLANIRSYVNSVIGQPTPMQPCHNSGGPDGPSGPSGQNEPQPNVPDLPMTDLTPQRQNAPDQEFIRLGAPSYQGNGDMLSGVDRPNPRDISNAVAAQGDERTFAANGASALLWSWGQFMDHDMTLSQEGHETADIAIPAGDPQFDPMGTGAQSIPFERSGFVIGPDGQRQQVNEQTPFVDASMVYGATDDKTHSLRSFEGGRMLVSDGDHLPVDAEGNVMAGDKRANEQPGLTALHTLFVREHNRIADGLSQQNPHMSDQQIFDKARRQVMMEIQAITYNEFLPTLLGDSAPSDLTFNPGTDGRISNEFATAAFRLGHTMVNETVAVKNADGSTKEVPLRELFMSPNFLKDNGVGQVLGGMAGQTAEAVDPMVVDSLRNALFGPPGSGGLDLASLNIQRGRDHGLPSYNDMREAMGLPRIESFNDPAFQGDFGAKMASVYDSPDDVDLWVGALAETPKGNSMLGETMTTIVAGQFAATAAADPNFYTNHASHYEMAWLNNLSLSDIIRANSMGSDIDDTAFIANDHHYGY